MGDIDDNFDYYAQLTDLLVATFINLIDCNYGRHLIICEVHCVVAIMHVSIQQQVVVMHRRWYTKRVRNLFIFEDITRMVC